MRAGGFRVSDGFVSPLDLVAIGLVSAEEAKQLHDLRPPPRRRARRDVTTGLILWLLAYAGALVIPFLAAAVLAILFSPVVDALHRHRVPRLIGATAVLLGLLGFGALLVWAIAKGIFDQAPQIAEQLRAARDAVTGWLTDLGLSERVAGGRPHRARRSAHGGDQPDGPPPRRRPPPRRPGHPETHLPVIHFP
jgi:hypothetical protein